MDFLASENEVNMVGQLLKKIIQKIDFGRDLEQQLKVLNQARGIFINFDQVTDLLVQKALQCSDSCLRLMKYRHTRKSLGFAKVQSCSLIQLDVHLLRRHHNSKH